ncbi:MAG: hypothetical protein O2782_08930 [bacterium]|nr:hypothetical protein [bacterium]
MIATHGLTQVEQQFEQGREYHLGLAGKKIDVDKALQHYLQAL